MINRLYKAIERILNMQYMGDEFDELKNAYVEVKIREKCDGDWINRNRRREQYRYEQSREKSKNQ